MKFFIDTANLAQIKEAQDLGVLDGVTTNPSLMAKEGISAGSQLTLEATEMVSVNLASSSAKYLKKLPEQEVYLISSVRAGEFLPLAQIILFILYLNLNK